MKTIGTLLLILGIVLGIYAFNMDTSVRVDYKGKNYGLPNRVNNLGLMNERQNYLIIAGIMSLVGVILIVAAKPTQTNKGEQGLKKCPQCAEMVKAEAKICRHCNYQFIETTKSEAPPLT